MFRRIALERAGPQLEGAPLQSRPMSLALLAALFLGTVLAASAFLATVSVARKVRASGVVVPAGGVIRVTAMQAGLVVARTLNEGDHVALGQSLFIVSSEQSSAVAEQSALEVTALLLARRQSSHEDYASQKAQVLKRMSATHDRVTGLSVDSQRLEEQVTLQRRRIGLAAETLARYERLVELDFISVARLDPIKAEVLDQEQRLHDLLRTKAAVERDAATARAEYAELQLQLAQKAAAEAQTDSALGQSILENESRRKSVVRAPVNGTIAALVADAGQLVHSQQTLASIIPDNSPLEARLALAPSSIGFVKPGMRVALRYDAYPYQKFGHFFGTVLGVSRSSISGAEGEALSLPRIGGVDSGNLFHVRVRLDHDTVRASGREETVRAGSTLEASILLEERKLYEWILEPLYPLLKSRL